MSIAGDHASNDMAGVEDDKVEKDEEKSWNFHLKKDGYATENVIKGIALYPEVNDIWIAHLKEAKAKLNAL